MATQTRKVPTAREWSENVSPRDFRLRDLDLYVLKQYDHVLRSLGWRGRYRAGSTGDGPRPAPSRRPDLHSAVRPAHGRDVRHRQRLVHHCGWGAMEFEGFDPGLGIPIVVACFVLSVPGPLLVLRRWWTSNRRWTTPEVSCLAFVWRAASSRCGGFGMPGRSMSSAPRPPRSRCGPPRSWRRRPSSPSPRRLEVVVMPCWRTSNGWGIPTLPAHATRGGSESRRAGEPDHPAASRGRDPARTRPDRPG